MINGIQKGMRCRTTKVIRTHGGLLGRFTEGTIQGVMITSGASLLASNGIAVLPRTSLSTISKSQLAANQRSASSSGP
jgi:hypothetical protein